MINYIHIEANHTVNRVRRGLVDNFLFLPPSSVSGASVTAVISLFDTSLRRGCPVQVSDAPMGMSDYSNGGSSFSMLISTCLACGCAAVGENADEARVPLHDDESRASSARLCSQSC